MKFSTLFLCLFFISSTAFTAEIKRTGDEAFLSFKDKLEKLFPKKTKLNEKCEVEILNRDENNFKIRITQKKDTVDMTFERNQVLAPARVEHPALEAFLDHTEIFYEESKEFEITAHHDTNRPDGNIQRGTIYLMDLNKPLANLKGNIAFLIYIQYIVRDGRFAPGPIFHCSMNGRMKDFGINTQF